MQAMVKETTTRRRAYFTFDVVLRWAIRETSIVLRSASRQPSIHQFMQSLRTLCLYDDRPRSAS
jgi:hypothetical protein